MIDDFDFLYIIGKGGYGKVWKVRDKFTGNCYALKQMTKAKIIAEGSEMSILRERIFLAKMHSPFIVNMFLAFQNKYNLFLLMELLTGGDLRYHFLNYNFYFTETQIKFLLSNIILGLEYIHKKGIVHRDLKPENVILNNQGYVKITDFGISCYKKELDKSDDSGTPAYMAPETILGNKQDYSVDYYSLGVIGYELIKGKVPYDANDRDEIIDMMKNDTINLLSDEKLRNNFSDFCLDFITKLLKKNPNQRLGSKKGEEELKKHNFFTGINWDTIELQKFKSPVYDIIQYSKMKHGYTKELFDFDYCNKSEHISPKMMKLYVKITQDINYPNYFKFYTCVCVENLMRELKTEEKKMKKKKRKLNRSSSIGDMESIYQLHKYPYNPLGDINLPFLINNPTEILRKHRDKEKKLKNYYENELLKYKDELDIIMNDYNIKKAQIHNLKDSIDPPIPKKHKHQKDTYDKIFSNYDQQPEPFLPLLGQGKIMQNFYNGINGNPNDFFYKNKNKRKHSHKKHEDDSSDYYTIKSGFNDDVKIFNNFPMPPPIYPGFDPNFGFDYGDEYSDPYFYEQNKKEHPRIKDTNSKKNKLRYNTEKSSKMIDKKEKDSEENDD